MRLIQNAEGCLGYRMTRRQAIGRAIAGAAGLWLGDSLPIRAWAAAPAGKRAGSARSVIQIWMWGGPSHLDTFDPKPDAGRNYCGDLLKPIETNVPGIRISELLPLLAQQADKYSIIRSMTHGNNAHETASYMVQTGRKAGEHIVYPCAGAVVSLFKGGEAGSRGKLPSYVVLTEPQGRFDEAGFLGTKYKPFATGGDPSQARFMVEGIVSAGITDSQQRSRRALLERLNTLENLLPDNAAMKVLAKSEDQAYDMILGDGGKVFDLSTEKDELRERYGKSKFGQSCLMARRLVEQGVPYITINYPGWDTHKNNFTTMRRKLPELDKGMATLIQDLSERGLLETTVVWWGGEFGRTPKVDFAAPWNGGRGHWGKVFSSVVAGGGFKGGHIVGGSDARGEEVHDRPVYPGDLIASIYDRLGIDTTAKLPHPEGLDVRVSPTPSEGVPTSGRLKEIV